MTLADLLSLGEEEIALLERRKSPDLTPVEMLRCSELQTRAWLLANMAEGEARTALETESLAFRAALLALPADALASDILPLARTHMALHKRVLEAARINPRPA